MCVCCCSNLAVPSISSAQSSSISVAPSVAGPSSSPIYHATSLSSSPAVPTPTPSRPQGVRARILTYTCIYKCIVLVVYSRSLCWRVLSNLRTLLRIYITVYNFTECIVQ